MVLEEKKGKDGPPVPGGRKKEGEASKRNPKKDPIKTILMWLAVGVAVVFALKTLDELVSTHMSTRSWCEAYLNGCDGRHIAGARKTLGARWEGCHPFHWLRWGTGGSLSGTQQDRRNRVGQFGRTV